MQWLASNWIWIVAIAAILAMHRFGHGGHRHGSGYGYGHAHGSRRPEAGWSGDSPEEASTTTDGPQAARSSHVHGAVGGTSNLPAESGATTRTGHEHEPTANDRRRHRHGC